MPVELHRAKDGEEALARLRHSDKYPALPRPNLILLNLNLPKKSGMEVLADLRADPELSPIPVVIFTSSSLNVERAKCLALGAVDYITKPNNFDGVVQAVQVACTRAAFEKQP